MTQLRSLNERRKIKLNNLARHLNVRLWSFFLVRNCVPLLVSTLVQHIRNPWTIRWSKMSMDPCEEFRMHAAKNVVGSRLFAQMSQV